VGVDDVFAGAAGAAGVHNDNTLSFPEVNNPLTVFAAFVK
jgi:hypothetical protein